LDRADRRGRDVSTALGHLSRGFAKVPQQRILACQMPELPVEIPNCDRNRRIGDPDILRPLHKLRLLVSVHRDSGEIAIDIGGENRGSRARKPFGENLLGYGLAGADGARDECVPVAKRKRQKMVNVAFADRNAAKFMRGIVGHGGSSNGGTRRGFAARLTWP
jgi:hypothetical protein